MQHKSSQIQILSPEIEKPKSREMYWVGRLWDTHVEYTGLQQVTPLSGPNQGTTRWVWKDSVVVDCYEKERNPGKKAFHVIEVAKKKRGGEGL